MSAPTLTEEQRIDWLAHCYECEDAKADEALRHFETVYFQAIKHGQEHKIAFRVAIDAAAAFEKVLRT